MDKSKRDTTTKRQEIADAIDIRPWYMWSKFPPISVTHPEIAKQWHPTKNGVETPDEFTYASGVFVWWKCPVAKDHVWQARVVQRTKSKSASMGCPFCSGHKPSVTNSLASCYPKVAREFHPTKNGKLKTKEIVSGSNKKVWWRCIKDDSHVWSASVTDRTRSASGCPYCAGRRVSKDNALSAVFPQAKKIWHPTKNGALRPTEVSIGMNEQVWWRCPVSSDHEWKAKIQQVSRSLKTGGSGCPFCSGRQLSNTNRLSTTYPEIALEWHSSKNKKLRASQIAFSSTQTVWWQCPVNASHVWQGSPYERTKEGRTCPYCRGWAVNESNSLATLRPKVAAQWHPTRNGKLTPDMVTEHSSRTVWWRCLQNKSHVFQAKIIWQAYIDEPRCPRCTPRRTPSEKSLAAKNPALANQWHPSLNGELTASQVTPSSTRRAWWQCPVASDHVWQQTCHARSAGSGCPFCAGHKPSSTYSLAVIYPHLATEWHPQKNGKLKPTDVTPGMQRRVWWRCSRTPDHIWAAAI